MKMKCPACKIVFDSLDGEIFCSKECERNGQKYLHYGTELCNICGITFVPFRNTTGTCGEKCRDKKRKNKPQIEQICPICNKKFTTSYSSKVCCSKKCRRSLYYQSNIEKFQEKRAERYWENPEHNRLKTKEWAKNNKDKKREQNKKYKDNLRFDGNRELVLKRDGYKCVRCGSENGLNIHHKDRSGNTDKPNNSPDNLETLCDTCHALEHKDEFEILQVGHPQYN